MLHLLSGRKDDRVVDHGFHTPRRTRQLRQRSGASIRPGTWSTCNLDRTEAESISSVVFSAWVIWTASQIWKLTRVNMEPRNRNRVQAEPSSNKTYQHISTYHISSLAFLRLDVQSLSIVEIDIVAVAGTWARLAAASITMFSALTMRSWELRWSCRDVRPK